MKGAVYYKQYITSYEVNAAKGDIRRRIVGLGYVLYNMNGTWSLFRVGGEGEGKSGWESSVPYITCKFRKQIC